MTSAASTGDASRMADSSAMMSICDAVHLVLIKSEPAGETHLVSSHYLEWRPVLAAPGCRCTMSLEMMGIGTEFCITKIRRNHIGTFTHVSVSTYFHRCYEMKFCFRERKQGARWNA